jgi:hypothetical protein
LPLSHTCGATHPQCVSSNTNQGTTCSEHAAHHLETRSTSKAWHLLRTAAWPAARHLTPTRERQLGHSIQSDGAPPSPCAASRIQTYMLQRIDRTQKSLQGYLKLNLNLFRLTAHLHHHNVAQGGAARDKRYAAVPSRPEAPVHVVRAWPPARHCSGTNARQTWLVASSSRLGS